VGVSFVLLSINRLQSLYTMGFIHANSISYARRVKNNRPSSVSSSAFFGDIFGGDEEKIELPKDVAALVENIKASTEVALNNAISRLDVETPPGYKFGVEGQKGRLLGTDLTDRAEIVRSDRELARVFVEMLQPIGDGLVVAFRTRKLAQGAKKSWKLAAEEAKLVGFPEKPKAAFAAEFGSTIDFKNTLRDLNCQCLVVVAPRLDQLRIVSEISDSVKDQMGIILLNSRIHGIERQDTVKMPAKLRRKMQDTFVPSFHIRFLNEKNTLLFHRMGETESPWILARQRELIGGQPVTQEIMRSNLEPSPKEIEEALASFEPGTTDQLLDFIDKDKVFK